MVVAGYVFVMGINDGDYRRLTYVYDKNYNSSDDTTWVPCGLGAKADYPYLYFADLSGAEADFYNSRVCVDACPTADGTATGGDNLPCWDAVSPGTACTSTDTTTPDLTFVIYESVTFLSTYCLPAATQANF